MLNLGPTQFVVRYDLLELVLDRGARVCDVLTPPEEYRRCPPFRVFVVESERNPDGWYIHESDGTHCDARRYGELHPEVDQKDLPVWSAPFTPLFLRMIEIGWQHCMATRQALGVPFESDSGGHAESLGTPEETTFFLTFANEDTATAAAAAMRQAGCESTNLTHFGESERGSWLVTGTIRGVRATEWDRVMLDIAERFDGDYDGDEIGPF